MAGITSVSPYAILKTIFLICIMVCCSASYPTVCFRKKANGKRNCLVSQYQEAIRREKALAGAVSDPDGTPAGKYGPLTQA